MTLMLCLTLAASIATAEAKKMGTSASVERQVIKLTQRQLMERPAGAFGGLILTSDEEMERMEKDPNMKGRAFGRGWEDMCKDLAGYDQSYINVAYDFFFGGDKREHFPTSGQCIRTFKVMHDIARKYGAGFGASILNPLDVGPAYYREKGRGGQQHQFQEGQIRPDGSFRVPVRIQKQWFHNKGPAQLYVKGVRAFAFSEQRIGDTPYYAVSPADILDVSESAQLHVDEKELAKTPVGYGYVDGAVVGKVTDAGKRDRVLAVVIYEVEEMDYFHADALPFLKAMLDAHKSAGITYAAFYSDEMHIQFDWDLGTHFGLSEIDTRYITPGLADKYARLYGERYRDMDRWLIYFAFAQHDFVNSPLPPPYEGKGRTEPEMAQHVFGKSAEDIYATWKFRRDYFRMLQDHVVDLFIEAKRYAEKIFHRERIWTRAHATWQESPTCDHVDAPWKPKGAPVSRYDYTPAFEWSSTIRESISACCDYFRWGDYLSGMGNDFPEGGWIDRNYYGAAMTASFGAFNEVPYSYWGHWGAPRPVSQRVHDVAAAYGLSGDLWNCGWVQDWQHRCSPVLALYPLDLNYVEERYGSWMVQYGYCDYLTEEKFAKMARVLPDGRFRVKDRVYTTLLVLFEPMILRDTMRKVARIGQRGGRVLWTGPPPAIYHEDGSDALQDWVRLFGLKSVREPWDGLNAEGAVVAFRDEWKDVPPFRVITHLLVDRVYPASPAKGTRATAVAGVGGTTQTLGTRRPVGAGGFFYFGGRPRDDQSRSIPDAPRTLFHLLKAIGAYEARGRGWAEIESNHGDLLVCESPNGAVSITHHYHRVVENWSGGFFRPEGEKFDESVLPPSRLELKDARLGPYTVSYDGERVVTFRLRRNQLVAFSGADTMGVTINGRRYAITQTPATVAFAPLPKSQLADGIGACWMLAAAHARGGSGDLVVRLPFRLPEGVMWVADPKGNGRGIPSPAAAAPYDYGTELRIPPEMQGVVVYLFGSE